MSTKPHRHTIEKQLDIEKQAGEVKVIRYWSDWRRQGNRTLFSNILGLIIFYAVSFMVCLYMIDGFLHMIDLSATDTLISWHNIMITLIGLVIPIYVHSAYLFNTTVIRVNNHHLIRKHEPIPWPGYKQFSLAELRQLYSRENQDDDKRGEIPLYLITSNLKPCKLLDKLPLSVAETVAKVIEQVVIEHGQQMIPYVQRNTTGVEGVTVEVRDNSLHIISRWRRLVSLEDTIRFTLGSIFGWIFLATADIFANIFGRLPADLNVWLLVVNIWQGGIWVGLFVLLAGLLFLILVVGGMLPLVGLYGFLVGFLNKSKVRVNSKHFEIKNGPLPYIRSKKFVTSNISQLYSKERLLPSTKISYYVYELYLITKTDHHYRLLTSAYQEQIMYLEQAIKDYLGLTAQAVRGEVDTGTVGRRKATFAAWQELADRHHLKFSNIVDCASLSGLYRGHSLKLESIQEKSRTTLTRLTITALQLAEAVKSLPSITIKFLLSPDIANLRMSGQFQIEGQGQTITYTQIEIETNSDYLQSLFDRGCDLLEALPCIVATGGQAAPALLSIAQQKVHPLQSISHYLLSEIAQETTQRLKPKVKQLVCPSCLTYCAAHPIQNHVLKIPAYYGCRNCGQSRVFFEITGQIIAVLDRQKSQKFLEITGQNEDDLCINWLTERQVFDFARIEIIQATDEEVERFVVQVANDTDPVRQPRYRTMPCVVAPECSLSENTLRILRRTFAVEEEKF